MKFPLDRRVIVYRAVVALFWVSICLIVYHDELLKGCLFAAGFGAVIMIYGPQGHSPNIDSIIYGIMGIIFVAIILAFRLFDHSLAMACLVAGMFGSIIFFRTLWPLPERPPKTQADKTSHSSPDRPELK